MQTENILTHFGNTIKKYRISKGLSQEQLAFKADLHRTYIGMIERAEKNITLINIQKLSVALEISLSDLFTDFNDNNR